jgi:hypothetical protein
MPLTVTSGALTTSVPLTVTYHTSLTKIVTDGQFIIVTDIDNRFRSCIEFCSRPAFNSASHQRSIWKAKLVSESLDESRLPSEPEILEARRRHAAEVCSHADELDQLLDRTLDEGRRILLDICRASRHGEFCVRSAVADETGRSLRDLIADGILAEERAYRRRHYQR